MVTIIILLILAGITIMQLSNSGLFENARLAEEKSKKSQNEENDILLEYESKIAEILGGGRELEFNNCTISITSNGTITLQPINGIEFKSFSVAQNGKWIGTTTKDKYSISVTIGQTVNIYVIAIDENMNIYKSNSVSYTGTGMYIYNNGSEYENITNGWNKEHDGNAAFGTETNLIHAISNGSSCQGWYITTNKSIDISNYSKICCKYTTSEQSNSAGLRLKLGNSKNFALTGSKDALYNSECFEYGKTDATFKWDISDIPDGEYFICVSVKF